MRKVFWRNRVLALGATAVAPEPGARTAARGCDDLPRSAEVVVIGGGVVGTAVAHRLAEKGIDVCLVEKGDIGSGTSSAAAVAALLQTKTSPPKVALALESLRLLDQMAEQFGPQFEYTRSGSLLVATSDEELRMVRSTATTLMSLGVDVELIGAAEARALMPALGPATIGASYSRRDATINPLSLVAAYAQAARRAGATLCTHTSVTGISTARGRILSVETTRGSVKTDTVVNAAGVWARELAEMAHVDLPIEPLKGELLVTEAIPPLVRGTIISAAYLISKTQLEHPDTGNGSQRSAGITVAQVARGNLIIGSTREPAGYDRSSTYGGILDLAEQLLRLAPSLAKLHIIRAYAGLRPITPDGLPIIGRSPGLAGLIVASGLGGDGLALSAVTAKLVTEIVAGADDDMLAVVSPERFVRSGVAP